MTEEQFKKAEPANYKLKEAKRELEFITDMLQTDKDYIGFELKPLLKPGAGHYVGGSYCVTREMKTFDLISEQVLNDARSKVAELEKEFEAI